MPRVLVIGGTSFIGRATVSALLSRGHDVTVCNRGKSSNPFDGRVSHVRCDRRRSPDVLLATLRLGWAVVVDFVAFEPNDVAAVTEAGGGCIGRYVFISTDSIYMAVDPASFLRAENNRLLESSDAQYVASADRAREDEYGADKLAAEAVLRGATSTAADTTVSAAAAAASSPTAPLRVLALRLPDVIGPHENTGRLHKLLVRLLRGRSIGTAICGEAGAGRTRPIGMVGAADVAEAVCAAVRCGEGGGGGEGGGDAFVACHVCSDETPTWVELVEMAASELQRLGLDVPAVRLDDGRDSGYVSVDCGPLDNSRAKRELSGGGGGGCGDGGVGDGWSAAPLAERVSEAVEWWVGKMRAEWEAEAAAEEEAEEEVVAPDVSVHPPVGATREDVSRLSRERVLRETLRRRRLRREAMHASAR